MKAFIYTGGSINRANIDEHPQDNELILAADAGYSNAIALGVKPTVLLGDFDSLPREELYSQGEDTEIITVPSEKDYTDTQLAVNTALKRGAKELVIIGGLDGRLDHTLSNLAILVELCHSQIRAVISDGNNRIRYIENDSIIIMRSRYKYISLIARGTKVKGVSVEGCKYPLCNATLSDSYQYAVSNEIEGNCAFISVRKGGLFIIESSDKA